VREWKYNSTILDVGTRCNVSNPLLFFVLYGCETWSLTLREERRLRVFENRVLRRVFGPQRDEVTGDWRKLHNEEDDEMGRAGHVAGMGEKRNA
jgi:hypothetical protein